jgi:lipopolysaccharide biosynthesis regulator YciM
MRSGNIFVSKWTHIRYHNTINALKKKKRRDKICPGVFSLTVIVVTVSSLDKWTQQFIPILERDPVFYNANLSAGVLFRRRALRA